MLPNLPLALVVVHVPSIRAHAEPELRPLLAAVAHGAVAVEVVELAAEGLAVEGGVEGGAAGDGGGVEVGGGYEGWVGGGGCGGGGDRS